MKLLELFVLIEEKFGEGVALPVVHNFGIGNDAVAANFPIDMF